MHNNKGNFLTEEQIESFLKDAVSSVETASEADIQAYNRIQKLFKKNVSLMRRSYVAAYLIKQVMSGSSVRSRFSHDNAERNDRYSRDRNSKYDRSSSSYTPRSSSYADRTSVADRPERAPRVQIDPSVATTIFISIGRNRRVFPRDLVGLLVSVVGLDRERIGEIRVLANYSFIQLFTDDCEKTISSLNGYEYRGRKLSVSYSRQRVDGIDSSSESSNFDSSSDTDATIANEKASASIAQSSMEVEDSIPANVSNESHGFQVPEAAESAKISEEQTAFAALQAKTSSGEVSGDNPFSETTDDGQVKSHFGSGAAY